jgi:hypothetical protein
MANKATPQKEEARENGPETPDASTFFFAASLNFLMTRCANAVSLECSRLPRTPKPTLGTLTQSCGWDIRYQAPPNSFFLAMISARRDRP